LDEIKKLRRILVIDDSRVVRATLNKHLRGSFELREEADGESAWQTLMLDASLSAVVCGRNIPRLSAHDLLARLKASSMRRLREIPFTLITSDLDNKVERDFDRSLGVDGFISKSMSKTELLSYLDNLFDSAVFTDSIIQPEIPTTEEEPPPVEPSFEPIFKTPQLLDRQAFQNAVSALSLPDPKDGKVCALVLGIDKRDTLVASFGVEAADMVTTHIARMLVTKVGSSDVIGRYEGEKLGIISYGVDLEQGVRFAQRVCRSLASGQITIRGKKVKLTASVGIASNGDTVSDGVALLALAEKRLGQALICGGNTVASECKTECPLRSVDLTASKLLDALNVQGETSLAANIGKLGLKLMPLLQVMDQELSLGLPLADIKQQLQERSRTESSTVDA
jgi:diguanylate cyclase (GGDEF)-like protein